MLVIPREICINLDQALTREWLVTNGLGGYASSTIAGANTRRYHGILVASLTPPSARVMMVAKLDEEVEVGGSTLHLGTNEYESGTIHPDGYLYLDRVELDGMIPTFYYRSSQFALSKTIWMEHGGNTTYVRYRLSPESNPILLTLLPLCTFRDFHAEVRGSDTWKFLVQTQPGQVQITAYPGATPYYLLSVPGADYVPMGMWYWRFRHRVEQERGLDSVEDLFLPGLLRHGLLPGQTLTVIATAEGADKVDRDIDAAFERERSRQAVLAAGVEDEFDKQLCIASDQFLVARKVLGAGPNAEPVASRTVIAGYPWFTDWGRDTMISLEGLTLVTRRTAIARDILLSFSRFVSQGMLPNRFPDVGPDVRITPVEYNTVDATLWYFHAISRYMAATKDVPLLHELYPILTSIVDWHVKGTRYDIHVDPSDGLLSEGAPGVQLTWMDAKVGDWVVTPRIGKPVEINALWYHALRLMEKWSRELGEDETRYRELAERVMASFDRYWFEKGGYLYDVIDGPSGDDSSLRPNQLFALSLEDGLVSSKRASSVLELVQRELLTPYGLRSLAPSNPNFKPGYRGTQRERDSAYHQGVVWPWLIGAYVDACIRFCPDTARLLGLLNGFQTLLSEAGLGTLCEILEGQAPYRPVGCIAQAWSVAEVLRARRRLAVGAT